MRTARDPYVRLLRWYPKTWRDVHGAVFMDTLREQSEHEGRTLPSRGERLAAMVNGLGTRLDARMAGRMALSALALTSIFRAFVQVFPFGGGLIDLGETVALNSVALACLGTAAALALAGVVSLMRASGVLSPGRAAAVVASGWAGIAVASLAAYAWTFPYPSVVDSSLPYGPAPAMLPLVVAALALGLPAGWLCVEGILSRTRLGRLPLLAFTALGAAVVTTLAEAALLVDRVWTLVAIVVVVLSLRLRGAWRPESPARGSGDAQRRRLALVLALVSVVVGVVGVVYAVTASAWSPVAMIEPAMAHAQGLLIALAGTLPLGAALTLRVWRPGLGMLHAWGPVALLCLVVVSLVSQRAELDLVRMPALGIALAWWVIARLRAEQSDRWTAGAAIVLAPIAFQNTAGMTVVLGLIVVIAEILAFRGALGPRRRPTTPSIASAAGD